MSIKTLSNYHLLDQLHLLIQKIKRIDNLDKYAKNRLFELLNKVNLDTKFNDTSGILGKDTLTAISQLCTAITWQQILFNVHSFKLLAGVILIALLFYGVISINPTIILFVALGASILSSHITTAKNELTNSRTKCSLFTKFKCVTIWAISRSFRDSALVYKETPSALNQSLYQKIRNLTIASPIIRENHSLRSLSTYVTGIGITSAINVLSNYHTPIVLLASFVLCGFLPLMVSNTKNDYKFSIQKGKEVKQCLRFNPLTRYIEPEPSASSIPDKNTTFMPISTCGIPQVINSSERAQPIGRLTTTITSTFDRASYTQTKIKSDTSAIIKKDLTLKPSRVFNSSEITEATVKPNNNNISIFESTSHTHSSVEWTNVTKRHFSVAPTTTISCDSRWPGSSGHNGLTVLRQPIT